MAFSSFLRISVIYLLMTIVCPGTFLAQETYDNCGNALQLCPNTSYSLNNIAATATVCPNCEDDLTFCLTSANSIWLTFTTNSTGGDVQLDFTNLVFSNNAGQDQELNATMLEATVPCDAASYTSVGNCATNQGGPFSLNANGLPASTTYYVIVSGDNAGAGITSPAECAFDVNISGTAINRPAPFVVLGSSTNNACQDEAVTLSAAVSNCTDTSTYLWYVNGTLAAETIDAQWVTSELQDGDVIQVDVSCFQDCPVTVNNAIGPITVFSFPVDAGPDQQIKPGSSVQLNGFTSAPQYTWSPNIELSNTNTLTPYASPHQTTVYTLAATMNGCTLYDQVTVIVDNALTIPTTFSPNNDGSNDVWEIEGIEQFPDNQLKIYDRWGQIIYQASGYNYQKAWDGRHNGRPLSEGVYFYTLDLRDADDQHLKGSITLVR